MNERNGDVDILRRIEDTMLNDPEFMETIQPSDISKSVISNYFKDKTIFITGGTGFLGAMLIEKLLRSCPEIRKIFVLVRGRNGEDSSKRLQNLLSDPLFDILRRQKPNFDQVLQTIAGDICKPDLGLDKEQREEITKETEIIFHVAATVRFIETMRVAIDVNLRGTVSILELARDCSNLLSVIHVSTAYSNCRFPNIDERVYKPTIPYTQLLELADNLSDEELEEQSLNLIGEFPNTYVFSKNVAEHAVYELVRKYNIPACIFRPSIVVATYREPLSGWANNLYGPIGVLVGVGTGVLRVINVDSNMRADLVPADMCAAALIASAWRTGNPRKELPTNGFSHHSSPANNSQVLEPVNGLEVYNYCSTPQKPITWGEFVATNQYYGLQVPTMKAVWYYGFSMYKSRTIHMIMALICHLIPAIIADSCLFLIGRKRRLLRFYLKIYRFSEALSFFTTRQWTFVNKNVQSLCRDLSPSDRRLFNFDMSALDWERHASTQSLGLRVYLVKDPASTLPQATIRWKRLYYLHWTVQGILYLAAAWLLYMAYSAIF